uniref:G-protein coupled receptors family 1 profile domain-containing protein n=1 Tax=Anopheles christyi TaxID=43041 RepID=A0A182K2D6_9DIPT
MSCNAAGVIKLNHTEPRLWMIFRVAKGPFVEDFYQCVTHGFYTDRWQEQLYTTFTLVFMFIIPLLILIGTYLSTFMTISIFTGEVASEAKVINCPCNN